MAWQMQGESSLGCLALYQAMKFTTQKRYRAPMPQSGR